MGRFVAAMFGLMSLAAPSWAQAPLKAAGQDVAPWAVHEKSTSALSGVFVDLTNAIAKQEGAVANLKIVNRQQDFMEALVDVDVRDVAHLSKVIAGLRGAVGIKGVERG